VVSNPFYISINSIYFTFYYLIASDRGLKEVVEVLLENKAEINSKNEKGNTALILGI
jgi:ankyrin repeat protein